MAGEEDSTGKPTIRERFQSRFGYHASALGEVIFVTIISLLPILVGTIIGYFQRIDKELQSYGTVIYNYLNNGELFLYCTSVLASVLFLASLDRAGGRFPRRKWFILVSIVCIVLSILFFTLRRVELPFDPLMAFIISCGVYVIALTMYYWLTAKKNADYPGYQEVMSEEASEFSRRLSDRRSG